MKYIYLVNSTSKNSQSRLIGAYTNREKAVGAAVDDTPLYGEWDVTPRKAQDQVRDGGACSISVEYEDGPAHLFDPVSFVIEQVPVNKRLYH